MKNRITQGLKLKNKLILTNKLLLSLHILELNTVDLEEKVMELSQENPFVEVDFSPPKLRSSTRKVDENSEDAIENTTTRALTLRNYILEQLYAMDVDEKLEEIVVNLVDLLDVHGFLSMNVNEIAKEFDFEKEDVQRAVEILRSFEPKGVGYENVKEALKAQTDDPVVIALIDEMEEVHMDPKSVMKKLSISQEEFDDAIEKLKRLNPYPANGFADSNYTFYIEPDITITLENGAYRVRVNDYFDVQLSRGVYEKLVRYGSEREKKFAKELFEKATSFIDALDRRKETLMKVGMALVQREDTFFRGGRKNPLKISEVAQDMELSLSTLARAVSTKYVRTPRGIFPLKFFFSRAVYSSNEGNVSREEVKEKIKEFIENEDRKNPLTDERIVALLKDEGIRLSRRVIAKYREELMIPSSSKRRVK